MELQFYYDLQDILIAVITVFSLALAAVGLYSYSRTRNTKLVVVSAAFVLFFIKGAILSYSLYSGTLDSDTLPGAFVKPFDLMLCFDLAILVTLYLAIFKR